MRIFIISSLLFVGVISVYVVHRYDIIYVKHDSSPTYNVGDIDANGRLVILAWNLGAYKSLDYDYAMRILETENKEVVYEFYNQSKKLIKSVSNTSTLEKLIKEVPEGSYIYNYDKYCGYMPFCRDEEIIKQVEEICAKYGIKFSSAEFGICSCPP